MSRTVDQSPLCIGCLVPKHPGTYCTTTGCEGHYDSEPSRQSRAILDAHLRGREGTVQAATEDIPKPVDLNSLEPGLKHDHDGSDEDGPCPGCDVRSTVRGLTVDLAAAQQRVEVAEYIARANKRHVKWLSEEYDKHETALAAAQAEIAKLTEERDIAHALLSDLKAMTASLAAARAEVVALRAANVRLNDALYRGVK